MNMKKVLAAIIAVMMAVSAMAITAFADDYKIELYQNADVNTITTTLTFELPVYALYGYMTPDYALELNLPKSYTQWNAELNDIDVNWSIVVNGTSYGLKPVKNTDLGGGAAAVYTQYVNFGFLTHDYVSLGGNDVWATIPQSTLVNDVTSVQLVATMTYPSNLANYEDWKIQNGFYTVTPWSTGAYAYVANAKVVKADTLEEVTNSISYSKDWNVAKASEAGVNVATYAFCSGEIVDSNTIYTSVIPLTWDHTLANKAQILGAETIKVVVELNKAINGQATYTLVGRKDVDGTTNGSNSANWWQTWTLNSSNAVIDEVKVDGSVTELVFELPLSALYNDVYGNWNVEFAIFENITLDSALLADAVTETVVCEESTAATYVCDKAEHAHTDACNGLVCTKEEHTHTDAELIVTGAVVEEEVPVVVCEEEHTHDKAACYEAELTCTKEEHTHESENCCDKEEHTHEAACYKTVTVEYNCVFEAHTHGDDCSGLVCEVEEHAHDNSCVAQGHVHTAACFTTSVVNGMEVDYATFGQNGTLGDFAWSQYNGGTTWRGAALNYAKGGNSTKGDVVAADMYILLSSSDDTVIEEVTDPVEPSTEEEEEDTVPAEPTEEPEEDTNPETGLALALVPMMVAAVAVVASKRR